MANLTYDSVGHDREQRSNKQTSEQFQELDPLHPPITHARASFSEQMDTDAPHRKHAMIRRMQRTRGNQAVMRMLGVANSTPNRSSDNIEPEWEYVDTNSDQLVIHGGNANSGQTSSGVHGVVMRAITDPKWMKHPYGSPEADSGIIELPKPYKWDILPAYQIDELPQAWSGQPNFSTYRFRPYFTDKWIVDFVMPRAKQRHEAYYRDWQLLQNSWNSTRQMASSFNIKSKTGGEGMSYPGFPDKPKPAVQDTDSDTAKPLGEKGMQVKDVFDESDPQQVKLKAKTPFDVSKLPLQDQVAFGKIKDAALEANNKLVKGRSALDSGIIRVANAARDVDVSKMVLKQSEGDVAKAGQEQRKADIEAEKAKVKAIFDIIGSIGEAAGAMSGKDKSYIGAAGAGVSGFGKLLTMQYDAKLKKIDDAIRKIEAKKLALQVQIDMAGVQAALGKVKMERNALNDIWTDLKTDANKADTASKELALAIEKYGKKLNMDKESIEVTKNAAGSLPVIESTLLQFEQVIRGIMLPTYSNDSGGGAAMDQQIGQFVSHFLKLSGYKQVLEQGKKQWENRRDAAHKGLGIQ